MFFREDFPVSPRRFGFFYGWVIVAVGTLGTLASVPGQTMGVSVFTDHLMGALGLTRAQLSLAYMFGTVCSGILMLRGGRWLDRFGVRRMIVAASLLLGGSLALMAVLGDIAYFISGVAGDQAHMVVAMTVAFGGFFLIRFAGQGMLAMIPRVMVGKWFNRRRGLAVGISGLFVSFGFATAPLVFNELINAAGWRGAYVILALAVGAGMSVIGWVFYREHPEDSGLMPDGDPQEEPHGSEAARPTLAVKQFTVEEARRTYSFWVYTFALASQGLIVTAVTFHIVSLSETAGLRAEEGLRLFLPMAVVNVASNFFGGWISDRIRLKYLLLVMMATQAVGTGGLLFFGEWWGQTLAVTGYGISGGLFGTLIGVTWPRFFGTMHLGAISGLNMAIMVLSSSFGPILFGLFFERTGSYEWGITLGALMPLVLFVAGLRANNPQETYHPGVI